ncbi:hypothetical protein [Chondrinema litorale]|uniref:hypothetical protein n=1 Tax=Chondrinema litorale TaxID=2994555 RepID=UPI002542CE09|nr:hypothetical protein [Chondrinema litorale]UZR93688.1 hypothetical protein OQ292_17720 [Chondrinema litorale]
MYIQFSELPASSRVWVYQSNRKFDPKEQNIVEDLLTNFISRWQSHGAELKGSFKIMYQQFIVLAVDTTTNLPSGCSIDSSVAALKEIEKTLNVDLFDRMNIAFLEENNHIYTFNFREIEEAINSGKVIPQTITFNNLVDTKEKFENEWLITASNSWLKKYFSKVTQN